MLLQQQELEQQANSGVSWSSPTTPHNKPLSFLEIQQEQEKQFTVREGGGVGGVASGTKGNVPSKKTSVSIFQPIALC